jgi:hypothetical protein
VLLATAVGLLLGYRAYAMLSDRHLNLERLYRFSQVVSNSPEIDEVLGNVLGEARELLRSERAEIIFLAAPHGAVARVRSGGSGRMSRSEEARSVEDDWLLDAVVPSAAGWRPRVPGRPSSSRYAVAPACSASWSCWTGSGTCAPTTTTTSCCWRPSPTTPGWRCRTAS